MPRQNPAPTTDDHGWLITPRALTSLATVVGLVYTLHAPVRYILQMGATVDSLNARVAILETVIDQQRGTIAAAAMILSDRDRSEATARSGAVRIGTPGNSHLDDREHALAPR